MQNHPMPNLTLQHLSLPHHSLLPRPRRILPIMTPIQRSHQLREDTPHEVLFGQHIPLPQLLDIPAQVAVAAVLHVEVDVVGGLDVLARVVLHDVGVAQGLEDVELGGELGFLAVGHAGVGDFFAAEDGIVGLAADFADDAEGALAWEVGSVGEVECEGMGGEGRYTDLLEDIVFLFFPSSFFRHNELCILVKYRLCNDLRLRC